MQAASTAAKDQAVPCGKQCRTSAESFEIYRQELGILVDTYADGHILRRDDIPPSHLKGAFWEAEVELAENLIGGR